MISRRIFLNAMTSLGLAGLSKTSLADTTRFLIGTSSSSSSYYAYNVAISQLLNAAMPDTQFSVVETGGTMDNIRRLIRRQVALGLITTNVMPDLYYGKGEFEGTPHAIPTLWVYVVSPLSVIVRKDAGITKLTDLSGRKFNPGLRGSATEKATLAVFKLLGIEPEFVRGSTGEIVSAIKDNRVVGYVKSGTMTQLDSSSQEIAAFTPVRVLGLDDKQAEVIQLKLPELLMLDVLGFKDYGIGAYKTWGFGTGTAGLSDLGDDLVYNVIKLVCEDTAKQAAAFRAVAGADLAKLTVNYASAPLHPGAIRYFKERGLDIPQRLMAS